MNWAKINKWLYKTILPVAVGVLLVILAVVYRNNLPTTLAALASFVTPLLALIDKLVGDAKKTATDVSTAVSDAKTGDVAKTITDANTVATDASTDAADLKAAGEELVEMEKEISAMGKGES